MLLCVDRQVRRGQRYFVRWEFKHRAEGALVVGIAVGKGIERLPALCSVRFEIRDSRFEGEFDPSFQTMIKSTVAACLRRAVDANVWRYGVEHHCFSSPSYSRPSIF